MSENYWTRRTSRRTILRGGIAGLSGLGLATLISCGGSDKSSGGAAQSGSPATGAVASGSVAPAQKIKRGGVIKGAFTTYSTSWDPHYSSPNSSLMWLMFDALLDWDKGPAVNERSLATKVEQADPTTIILTLRQGVQFQDNTPFNAQSVVWNLARATQSDPAGAVWKEQYSSLERVEAVNDTTAKLILKQPDASILSSLSVQAGMMASPSYYESKGKGLEAVRLAPMGTGAYRLDKTVQDQFVSWKPYAGHWRKVADGGSAALVDEIRWETIPDPTVLGAALQSGQIHLTQETPDSQYDILDKDPSLAAYELKGFSQRGMWINHALPPFDNVDFRRAVAWAIDAKALNDTLFSGKYTIADSWMHPESWAYKPAKDYPKFDVAKAEAFLERSGVPADKRRIKITSPDNVKTQFEFWQEALDKYLGIESDFVTDAQSKGKLSKNLGENPEIHMKVTGLSAKPDPHLAVSTQLTKGGTFNYSGESVGAIEPLVGKAVSTYNMEERKKLYAEIQDIQADQLYSALPKCGKPFLFHATKKLKGARFTHDFRGSVIDLWLDS